MVEESKSTRSFFLKQIDNKINQEKYLIIVAICTMVFLKMIAIIGRIFHDPIPVTSLLGTKKMAGNGLPFSAISFLLAKIITFTAFNTFIVVLKR